MTLLSDHIAALPDAAFDAPADAPSHSARHELPALALPPAPFSAAVRERTITRGSQDQHPVTVSDAYAPAPVPSQPAPALADTRLATQPAIALPDFNGAPARPETNITSGAVQQQPDRRRIARNEPDRRTESRAYASPWMARPHGGNLDPRPSHQPPTEPRLIRPLDARLPYLPHPAVDAPRPAVDAPHPPIDAPRPAVDAPPAVDNAPPAMPAAVTAAQDLMQRAAGVEGGGPVLPSGDVAAQQLPLGAATPAESPDPWFSQAPGPDGAVTGTLASLAPDDLDLAPDHDPLGGIYGTGAAMPPHLAGGVPVGVPDGLLPGLPDGVRSAAMHSADWYTGVPPGIDLASAAVAPPAQPAPEAVPFPHGTRVAPTPTADRLAPADRRAPRTFARTALYVVAPTGTGVGIALLLLKYGLV